MSETWESPYPGVGNPPLEPRTEMSETESVYQRLCGLLGIKRPSSYQQAMAGALIRIQGDAAMLESLRVEIRGLRNDLRHALDLEEPTDY